MIFHDLNTSAPVQKYNWRRLAQLAQISQRRGLTAPVAPVIACASYGIQLAHRTGAVSQRPEAGLAQ